MQTTAIPNAGVRVARSAKRRRGHRGLQAFVGTWRLEGEQYGNMLGCPTKVTGEESYEWLPGRLFLIHRMVGRLGSTEMAFIEVIHAESLPKGHRMHSFYSDGRSQDWILTENDDNWTITAYWSRADGSSRMLRCTMTFGEDGNTRNSRWEISTYGVWKTFWVATSARCR